MLLAFSPCLFGQLNVVNLGAPEHVVAKAGTEVPVKVRVHVSPGYHLQSNTPSDEYLIALRLTWMPGALESPQVTFPKPQMEKYSFSEKPLSVFSGDFEINTRFKVSASAAPGTVALTGKLRYQACNDRMCLAPKTIDVTQPVEIVK